MEPVDDVPRACILRSTDLLVERVQLGGLRGGGTNGDCRIGLVVPRRLRTDAHRVQLTHRHAVRIRPTHPRGPKMVSGQCLIAQVIVLIDDADHREFSVTAVHGVRVVEDTVPCLVGVRR
eukprot:3939547-Rhodomonas_salina.2